MGGHDILMEGNQGASADIVPCSPAQPVQIDSWARAGSGRLTGFADFASVNAGRLLPIRSFAISRKQPTFVPPLGQRSHVRQYSLMPEDGIQNTRDRMPVVIRIAWNEQN